MKTLSLVLWQFCLEDKLGGWHQLKGSRFPVQKQLSGDSGFTHLRSFNIQGQTAALPVARALQISPHASQFQASLVWCEVQHDHTIASFAEKWLWNSITLELLQISSNSIFRVKLLQMFLRVKEYCNLCAQGLYH